MTVRGAGMMGARLGDALLHQVIVEAFQRFAVLFQGESVHGVGALHLDTSAVLT